MLKPKPTRWLWPIVGMLAIVWAGCGSPPATDETDPLPRIFDNKKIDPSRFGAALGREMPGAMPMPMDMDASHRHEHAGESGSGYGDQKAKTQKAADEKKEGSDKEQP